MLFVVFLCVCAYLLLSKIIVNFEKVRRGGLLECVLCNVLQWRLELSKIPRNSAVCANL